MCTSKNTLKYLFLGEPGTLIKGGNRKRPLVGTAMADYMRRH